MNFNLFSIIAASAISATVALPAQASVEVADKKNHATQTYTSKYLQQSANYYAALDHKIQQ
jgi:nucleoside-specific outer membrane channel protein Tsx